MQKFQLTRYATVAIAMLLYAIPALATEPIQPLLAELIRPNAPMLTASEPPALVPADEIEAEDADPAAPVADLFSLEELHEKNGGDIDLALPDVDLPISDIPLALNNKVEYFLYYFQTRGKQSFSHWLSRSSRYIPMMKEILKREGMPEDLV
jgi:membrane-bound lytic murein transglycosylase D